MLVLLGVFVVRQTRTDLIAQIDDRMTASLSSRIRESKGSSIARQAPSEPQAGFSPPTPPTPPTPAPAGDSRSSASLVYDRSGSVTFFRPSGTSQFPDPQPLVDRVWLAAEFSRFEGVGAGRTFSDKSGRQTFRVFAALRSDGQLELEATPLRSVNQSILDLIRTLIIGSLAILSLAVLTIFLVLRRSLQPLGSMTHAVTRIAEGDVSLIPGVASPHTELNELGAALDRMVVQLRTSIDAQAKALTDMAQVETRLRRFISDASHELQTPITSVRGWAELYRQGALAKPHSLARAMARIETESARMGRLVDDLLTLARSDEHRQTDFRPIDVGHICADAVTDARAIDQRHQVSYEDNRTAVSLIACDPDRIRQVLDNLLNNARRHCVEGTASEVSLIDESSFAVIVVRDNGAGFHEDHLATVFDRFWTADRVANADRRTVATTAGSGLGLAIVRTIVEAHGGSVSASNTSRGGAQVEVRLPLSTFVRII